MKGSKPFEERVAQLKLEKRVYERWCELKVRMAFRTNTSVAEYLLDLAETYDQHAIQRYVWSICDVGDAL